MKLGYADPPYIGCAHLYRDHADYGGEVDHAPLIERGLTKANCLALLQGAGIAEPVTYAMGFPNANCLKSGCGKASSPDYWALHRKMMPEGFGRTAALARRLGARLARIDGIRVYIDDIPADWPTTNPIAPECDLMCDAIRASLQPSQ